MDLENIARWSGWASLVVTTGIVPAPSIKSYTIRYTQFFHLKCIREEYFLYQRQVFLNEVYTVQSPYLHTSCYLSLIAIHSFYKCKYISKTNMGGRLRQ